MNAHETCADCGKPIAGDEECRAIDEDAPEADNWCWSLFNNGCVCDASDYRVPRAEHRAAMVRVVVAQQWATAIALWDPLLWAAFGQSFIEWPGARRIAALPCAVDVVADLLGEVR